LSQTEVAAIADPPRTVRRFVR